MSFCGIYWVCRAINGYLCHDRSIIRFLEIELHGIGSHGDTILVLHRYDAFRILNSSRGYGNRAPVGGCTRYFRNLLVSVFPRSNSKGNLSH